MLKSRLVSILFWSVISAAFIGPGTVTTAAKAGAAHQLDLLWALVFSTFACIILQEAAARMSIATGLSLGEAISKKYQKSGSASLNFNLGVLVGLAVIIGCAAYQAGNILGAVSGVTLIFNWNSKIITTAIVVVAVILLWVGKPQKIANLLGFVVAAMGVLFLFIAFQLPINPSDIFTQAFIPTFPSDSSQLIIGLVGTTIVPYNLFLASGITKGQNITEMRFGLSIAILLGGIISIAILIVGSSIEGQFSFLALSNAISQQVGSWAGVFFGWGLFAAGFTSSITAPLAAAITAKSVFRSSKSYQITWVSVLLFGFLFGITEIKPIPAIILAQVLNGLLLPLVAIFLFLIVNDKKMMGESQNSKLTNVLMLLVVVVAILLGGNGLVKLVLSFL